SSALQPAAGSSQTSTRTGASQSRRTDSSMAGSGGPKAEMTRSKVQITSTITTSMPTTMSVPERRRGPRSGGAASGLVMEVDLAVAVQVAAPGELVEVLVLAGVDGLVAVEVPAHE